MQWRELGLRLIASIGTNAIGDRGRLSLTGLRADASVTRDERGVPWIEARDDADLYFAAGFAHAGDRLWQMDILRRRARGRLSELFGAATLGQDIVARSLGLTRVACRSVPELSAACRGNLVSFSAGVNAAIRRMRRRAGLPPEFLLLGYRPEQWTPLDSVVIVKQLGFDLAVNLRSEVFRSRLHGERPRWLAQFAPPRYPSDGPVTVHPAPAPAGDGRVPNRCHPSRTGGDEPALPSESLAWLTGLWDGEHMWGSNAWVVSGELTDTGAPLLANDPHLLFTRPSPWYQLGLRLHGDGIDATCYGVTVPGVPGIIAGANRELAWGITNATVDTQDLCSLPAEPPAGRWSTDTTVMVRGSDPVRCLVAGGERHVELTASAPPGAQRHALFWSGLLPSAEIQACQRLWRCGSYREFREVLRDFSVPVLNVLVACRDGDIALKTAGRIPRRTPGSGRAPAAFAEVAASWEEFVAFEELPEVVNPPEGYIVSANHRLVTDDSPLDLGADWAAPYRAQRIEQLIRGSRPITAELAASWQLDTANGRAHRVLPTILDALDEAPPADPLTGLCHRLLRSWDGRDEPEQGAPLVFFRLMQALSEEWISSRLGADLAAAMPDRTLQVDHLVATPSARTAIGEDRPLAAAVGHALTRACRHIADELGPDVTEWRYDSVHRILDPHPITRAGTAAAMLFGGPATPVGGSGHSVCLMTPNERGEVVEGAPWRFVAAWTPTGPRLWDVLRHGGSGHPRSPHYDDQTAAHARGRLYQVSIGGPGTAGRSLLRLRPTRYRGRRLRRHPPGEREPGPEEGSIADITCDVPGSSA